MWLNNSILLRQCWFSAIQIGHTQLVNMPNWAHIQQTHAMCVSRRIYITNILLTFTFKHMVATEIHNKR